MIAGACNEMLLPSGQDSRRMWRKAARSVRGLAVMLKFESMVIICKIMKKSTLF